MPGTVLDARLARNCLTEGEAQLYAELATNLLWGLPIDLSYWDRRIERHLKAARDDVARADSPVDALYTLVYAVGERYLLDAWLDGGNWAVQALYDAPPNSTLVWMLGYESGQQRRQPALEGLSAADVTPPEGYERVARSSLGALAWFGFLAHNSAESGVYSTELNWQRAHDWRQDRFEIFLTSESGVVVAWRLRLASTAAVDEAMGVVQAMEAPGLEVRRSERELTLFGATDPESLSSFLEANRL
jgi:hypothetical protein